MSLVVSGWSADVEVDHVLLVCRNAAATAERLVQTTGLASVLGGVHTGLGTRNLIVPLGEGFLELVEVHDLDLARANPFGRLVMAGPMAAQAVGRDESLFAWSVAVPDVHAAAEREGLATMRLGRAGVSVSLAGADDTAVNPARPFLIQREGSNELPGQRAAEHRRQPRGFGAMAAACSGDPDWLSEVPAGMTRLTLVAGQPRLLSVEIAMVEGPAVMLTSVAPIGGA